MTTHAQAVEAAKLTEQVHNTTPDVHSGTEGWWRHQAVNLARHILSLSAPGPSRDAATAEKCRAFVWRLMAASMRHAATRGEGEAEREAMAESFAAELLAMFAGGTWDARTNNDRIFAASDLLSRLDEIAEAYHEGEYRLPIADDATRKKMLDAIEEALGIITEPAK